MIIGEISWNALPAYLQPFAKEICVRRWIFKLQGFFNVALAFISSLCRASWSAKSDFSFPDPSYACAQHWEVYSLLDLQDYARIFQFPMVVLLSRISFSIPSWTLVCPK